LYWWRKLEFQEKTTNLPQFMEGLYSAVKVSFIRRGNIQCTVLKCMYKLFIYVQGFETIIEELIATLEMRNNNKITVPFFP
jgi:hypothetical protein